MSRTANSAPSGFGATTQPPYKWRGLTCEDVNRPHNAKWEFDGDPATEFLPHAKQSGFASTDIEDELNLAERAGKVRRTRFGKTDWMRMKRSDEPNAIQTSRPPDVAKVTVADFEVPRPPRLVLEKNRFEISRSALYQRTANLILIALLRSDRPVADATEFAL